MSESSQTLARGLKLLDLFAAGKEGVSVRELADAMQLPRSIVQRLLYTLEANGFLERHPSHVGYRLTIKLWGLGCAAIRRLSLRDVARPHLESLAQKTSEMAKIGVLDGADVVYVDKVDCPRAVRAYVPIGGRAPAHAVATGKAILAFLPPERLAAILTSVARKDVATEFEQIRRRGYAVNRGEWEQDVGAIAAPIFGAQGDVEGSIGIILPAHRLTAAKTTQMGGWIRTTAEEVSRQLGYPGGREPRRLKQAG